MYKHVIVNDNFANDTKNISRFRENVIGALVSLHIKYIYNILRL